MITHDCMNAVLPIVADSWERLRGCDVSRLLESIHYDSIGSLNKAGDVIVQRRPDLSSDVAIAVRELTELF